MRKISSFTVNWIIVLIMLGLLVMAGINIYREHRMKPGDAALQVFDLQEKIAVEIMSRDYLENHEYLLKVKIDGEQVGIVYFDKNGEIRFDGDKEKFEYGIYRAFKLREEYWTYEKEEK